MIQEFDFDPAYTPKLNKNTDEFMLADDADLEAQEQETRLQSELVPYGWDHV